MATPTYARGKKALKIPVTTVISLFKILAQEEKIDDFLTLVSEQEDCVISASPAIVNLVKRFIADHNLHAVHPAAATMAGVGAQDCPNYHCPHIPH